MHLFIGKKDTQKRRDMVGEVAQVDKDLAGRMTRFMGDVIVLTPREEDVWESRGVLKAVETRDYNYFLTKLIEDEKEAITAYGAAIKLANQRGYGQLARVLELIQREETRHLDILRKRLVELK